MTSQERLTEINALLSAFTGWAALTKQIDQRVGELTAQLVNKNDDETRGRIKALLELKELPVALQAERDGISAALSEQDAAS
jgi:hypothetical protein